MKVFGQGAVNIAGHKISYGLLAALAGIAGAILLVIQLNRSGSSLSAGSAPASYDPGYLSDPYALAGGGPSVTGDGSSTAPPPTPPPPAGSGPPQGPSFFQWLNTPNRPDIQAAETKAQWNLLFGEYTKELANTGQVMPPGQVATNPLIDLTNKRRLVKRY